MNTTTLRSLLRSALVVALLGVLAGTAAAQCTTDTATPPTTTCNLVADTFTWGAVPMWGFAADPGGTTCNSAPYPAWTVGPLLQVDLAGAPGNLVINLRNCLAEKVSIVVPGLPLPTGSAPEFAAPPDPRGRTRATSFTREAAASVGTVAYSWTGV